jgi:hypothetical protein
MCGERKPLDDFMWSNKAKGERDCYCRPCRAVYKKAHYNANKQRYIENARVWNDKLAIERGNWLLDYFETHPCVDCGETDPVVLEFDHLRDKRFNISDGIANKPWALVLAEIAKCDVVCANCHRRRTARRGGFARVAFVGWTKLDAQWQLGRGDHLT